MAQNFWAALLVGAGVYAGWQHLQLKELKIRIATMADDTHALAEKLADRDRTLNGLRDELSHRDGRIAEMTQFASGQAVAFSDLQRDLEQQRVKTDAKRRDYQALLNNPKDNPARQGKIKDLRDEIQIYRQRLTAIDQDLTNSALDASRAKQGEKSDGDFRRTQARVRVKTVEDLLKTLREQRSQVARQPANFNKTEQLRDLDSRVIIASQQLAELKNENLSLEREIHAQERSSQNESLKSTDELKRERDETRRRMDQRSRELAKLENDTQTSSSVQKERDLWVKKIASELQEEMDKLRALEDRARGQKAGRH